MIGAACKDVLTARRKEVLLLALLVACMQKHCIVVGIGCQAVAMSGCRKALPVRWVLKCSLCTCALCFIQTAYKSSHVMLGPSILMPGFYFCGTYSLGLVLSSIGYHQLVMQSAVLGRGLLGCGVINLHFARGAALQHPSMQFICAQQCIYTLHCSTCFTQHGCPLLSCAVLLHTSSCCMRVHRCADSSV